MTATTAPSQAPAANPYLKTKVMTASPSELRLMLLEGAIRFATQARQGLAAGDFENAYANTVKVQNILLELINSLRPDHEPDLCQKLSGLYTFMYMRMVKAGSERDPALIDEVLGLLDYERQTWCMLIEQVAAAGGADGAMLAAPDASASAPFNARATQASSLIGGSVSLQG
jgi:flagellar secretion chaperone FliS